MSKVLVTGGCGFIGSHLVDRLVTRGDEVVVLDNLSSDSNETFYYNEAATYIKEDILKEDVVYEVTRGCDHVFHLAAESRIGPTLLDPTKACQVNVVGTCNVLQAAKNYNVKSVVYSSTSACYGLSETLPQKETDKIDNLNPYSVTKYAGEDLCHMYHKLWRLPVTCLRYFNVFGERMPVRGQYAPVVGIFLRQKSAGEKLTIVGDGLQRRDFIHVYDVVDANIRVSQNINCFGQTYNVGSGTSYSVLDIAKSISSNYEHIAPRLGEARNTNADYLKLNTETGWEPSVDLYAWIKKQIEK